MFDKGNISFIYNSLSDSTRQAYLKKLGEKFSLENSSLDVSNLINDYDNISNLIEADKYLNTSNKKVLFVNLDANDINAIGRIIKEAAGLEGDNLDSFVMGRFLTINGDLRSNLNKIDIEEYKQNMLEVLKNAELPGITEKTRNSLIAWYSSLTPGEIARIIVLAAAIVATSLALIYGSQIAAGIGLSVGITQGVIIGGAMLTACLTYFYKNNYKVLSSDLELCRRIAKDETLTLDDLENAPETDIDIAFALLFDKINTDELQTALGKDAITVTDLGNLLPDKDKDNFILLASHYFKIKEVGANIKNSVTYYNNNKINARNSIQHLSNKTSKNQQNSNQI